jgi:hypothetical protein
LLVNEFLFISYIEIYASLNPTDKRFESELRKVQVVGIGASDVSIGCLDLVTLSHFSY